MQWNWASPTEDVARECEAESISDFLTLPDLVGSFYDLGWGVFALMAR